MMSPALKHCLLENDIIFEYSRKLAATCGSFELLGFLRAFTCSDEEMGAAFPVNHPWALCSGCVLIDLPETQTRAISGSSAENCTSADT